MEQIKDIEDFRKQSGIVDAWVSNIETVHGILQITNERALNGRCNKPILINDKGILVIIKNNCYQDSWFLDREIYNKLVEDEKGFNWYRAHTTSPEVFQQLQRTSDGMIDPVEFTIRFINKDYFVAEAWFTDKHPNKGRCLYYNGVKYKEWLAKHFSWTRSQTESLSEYMGRLGI